MKRGGSAKLGMLTRESSLGKLREEERLRTLAKQDTRGKLIAAAQEREAREKATAGPKLITDAKPDEVRRYRPPEKKPTKVESGKKDPPPSRPQPPLPPPPQYHPTPTPTTTPVPSPNPAPTAKPTPTPSNAQLAKLKTKFTKKCSKPLKLLAKLRKTLRSLTQQPAFFLLIIGTVLLSCVVLALNAPYASYMSPGLSEALNVLEILCTSVFTLEAVIVFIALGPSHYLRSGSHIFELVIVIGCWVDSTC